MRIATILGTRPEIIRLSKIIPLLDELLGRSTGHCVFHSGQNYDPELDSDLFAELGLRAPDVRAEAGGGSFAQQLAAFLPCLEALLRAFQPDRFLVLGDTNSSVGALVAARLGIPVYHLEAGNRCHGPESPEEVNRRVIDHVSTVHLCYSERARMNLVAEGLPLARTFVVGNPLVEVLEEQFAIRGEPTPWQARTWERVGLGEKGLKFLATLHRAENVDGDRLWKFLNEMSVLAGRLGAKVLMSTHPRTRSRIESAGLKSGSTWPNITFSRPLPFSDFIALEATADCVLSDSGTAPEECAILGKPLVILRDYCERQELLERGIGVLWTDRSQIPLSLAYEAAIRSAGQRAPLPEGYEPRPVAATVARLLLSPVPPA